MNINIVIQQNSYNIKKHNVVCSTLSHMFNHSLITGEIPVEWKSANITPIWKGDMEKVDNYQLVNTSHSGKGVRVNGTSPTV